MEQTFFEDVTEGSTIPHEVRIPITTQCLVKWTCAVGDFFEIHYDREYAHAMGLPDVIVHGPFKCALLARMLTEWIGEQGILRRLTCQHRKMDVPGDVLICRGRVLRKFVQEGENLLECEVWVENQQGKISAPGRATVSLPSRRLSENAHLRRYPHPSSLRSRHRRDTPHSSGFRPALGGMSIFQQPPE